MQIRRANKEDIVAIIAMLADDELGKTRENFKEPLPERYYQAFEKINSDTNQHLVVMEGDQKEVIATLQLSFIPYLTHQGVIRAQIEAVRVHKNHRGKGIGQQLLKWAIKRAKEEGAWVLQLTSDKKRPKAIAFYRTLGFLETHEGMKLKL